MGTEIFITSNYSSGPLTGQTVRERATPPMTKSDLSILTPNLGVNEQFTKLRIKRLTATGSSERMSGNYSYESTRVFLLFHLDTGKTETKINHRH